MPLSATRPKVIHIIPDVAQEASGPTYAVTSLCRALIDLGHGVTLAALDRAPLANAPAFLATFPAGLGPRRLGRSPSLRRWLTRQCRSRAAALLHNHGMWMMNAVYPASAAAASGVPLVQSVRGAFAPWAMAWGSRWKPLFWRLLQGPAMDQVACFHATAEEEYRDIRRLRFRQPVAIIPNGVHVPDYHPKRGASPRTLLFLGRIHPNKGLDVLLPAWREVQEAFPRWRLRIVGPDNEGHLTAMQALAAGLGLQRVNFDGPAYGPAKLQAYREAELFILPSYSENFGMSVAEALAAGTPAIVTNCAPWSGLERESAGWWIDLGVEPLVACLKQAMAMDPAELAAMGLRGREWMLRDFGWTDIGRQMSDTYAWLLDRNLPVPPWVRLD